MPEPGGQPPNDEEFEEFVAAVLKVDPKGLSGKHRRKDAASTECREESPGS